MKKILISAALLLAFVPCLVMARTVNDTLTIVKITAKIITKNGKPFEGKRYINFHLNDGRVIVLEDKEKDDASPDKIMSDKGRIYQDGLQEGVFKTTLSSWKEAYCGQQVIIRAHGRKHRCNIH